MGVIPPASSAPVVIQRVCPWCGKTRPPTGGEFCNTYCTSMWLGQEEQKRAERGGAPYVLSCIAQPYSKWVQDELRRKDNALDVALKTLGQLSKTGSITRDLRESTVLQLQNARNERLF